MGGQWEEDRYIAQGSYTNVMEQINKFPESEQSWIGRGILYKEDENSPMGNEGLEPGERSQKPSQEMHDTGTCPSDETCEEKDRVLGIYFGDYTEGSRQG